MKSAGGRVMTPHDSSIVNWHHTKPSVVCLNSQGREESGMSPLQSPTEDAFNNSNKNLTTRQRQLNREIIAFDDVEEETKKVQYSPRLPPSQAAKQSACRKQYSLGSLLSREYDNRPKVNLSSSLFAKSHEETYYTMKNNVTS